jgi:hypothetical protein
MLISERASVGAPRDSSVGRDCTRWCPFPATISRSLYRALKHNLESSKHSFPVRGSSDCGPTPAIEAFFTHGHACASRDGLEPIRDCGLTGTE